MHDAFRQLARTVSTIVGTPQAFVLALAGVDLSDEELSRLEGEFKRLRLEAHS